MTEHVAPDVRKLTVDDFKVRLADCINDHEAGELLFLPVAVGDIVEALDRLQKVMLEVADYADKADGDPNGILCAVRDKLREAAK